jgi:DnaJ-class molecular chaperone
MNLEEVSLADLAHELARRAFRKCRRCDGRGIVGSERVMCGRCRGSGKTSTGKSCASCGGVGFHEVFQYCRRCGGNGLEEDYLLSRAASDVLFVARGRLGPLPEPRIPPLDSELAA